jgi:hypothetical protein
MRISLDSPSTVHGYLSVGLRRKSGVLTDMIVVHFDALRFGDALEFPGLVKLGEIGFLADCDVVPMTH